MIYLLLLLIVGCVRQDVPLHALPVPPSEYDTRRVICEQEPDMLWMEYFEDNQRTGWCVRFYRMRLDR